jgi:RNA polymerase sigma factor (sigma-70 family)
MKPQSHEQRIAQAFDSYCKKILKYAARDYYEQTRLRGEREISFSELSARELAGLSAMDNYFMDAYAFNVFGENVGVTDAELAEALNAIPADRRDIVLMSYFFDMTDREIAEKLNMARRTVAYQRTSILRELRKILESGD